MSNRQKNWTDTISSPILMEAQDAFLGRDLVAWNAFLTNHQQQLGEFALLKQLIDVAVKDDWLDGVKAVRHITSSSNTWIWRGVNAVHFPNTPLALAAQKGSWKVAQYLCQDEGIRSHFVAQSLLMGLPTDKRPLRATKARVKTLSIMAQSLDISSLFSANRNTMTSSLGHALLNDTLEGKQSELIAIFAQKVGYQQLWAWTRQHSNAVADVMGPHIEIQNVGAKKAKAIEQLWLATPSDQLPDDVARTLHRWAKDPAAPLLMPQLVAEMDKKALLQAVETVSPPTLPAKRKVM